jgi:hypothetical protein
MTEQLDEKQCEHYKLKYCHDCYAYKCEKCGLSIFTCKLGGDD